MMTIPNHMEPNIVEFIASFRDSFIGAEHVYMNGSCFYFAKTLRKIFPLGELYENHDHVYFKLNDRFYDIRGEVHPPDNLTIAKEPTQHGKFDLFEFVEYHKRLA